jgi:hypothetical protein
LLLLLPPLSRTSKRHARSCAAAAAERAAVARSTSRLTRLSGSAAERGRSTSAEGAAETGERVALAKERAVGVVVVPAAAEDDGGGGERRRRRRWCRRCFHMPLLLLLLLPPSSPPISLLLDAADVIVE